MPVQKEKAPEERRTRLTQQRWDKRFHPNSNIRHKKLVSKAKMAEKRQEQKVNYTNAAVSMFCCLSVSFLCRIFEFPGKTRDLCHPMLSRERLSGLLMVQVFPERCLMSYTSVDEVQQCSIFYSREERR